MKMIIYEGTVEEIQEVMEQKKEKIVIVEKIEKKEVKKQEPNPNRMKEHRKGWNAKRWTKAENDIIRQNPKLDKVVKLLPNRSLMAIRVQRHMLGVKNPEGYKTPAQKRTVKNLKKIIKATPDSIQRIKFMNNRGQYYMKTYNWNRQKAMIQASIDWKNHKATIGTVIPASVEEKKILFKLVRWTTIGGKTEDVGTYNTYDEAKDKMNEMKIGDQSIDEHYQYAIMQTEVRQ